MGPVGVFKKKSVYIPVSTTSSYARKEIVHLRYPVEGVQGHIVG